MWVANTVQRKTNLLELSSDRDVILFIDEHLEEKVVNLGLRFSGKVKFSLPETLEWLAALQKAKTKLPSWYEKRCVLTKRATEQASSEEASIYKTRLYSGVRLLNLCGGLGVDDVAFSKKFDQVISLEADEELSLLSEENDRKLGVSNVQRVHAKAEGYLENLSDGFNLIYADPDRRTGEKRLVSLEDCVPDIPGNWKKIQMLSSQQLLKLSPMYPLEQLNSELSGLKEIEVVSIRGEVKEVLAHCQTGYSGKIVYRAIELHPFQEFEVDSEDEAPLFHPSENMPLNFYEVHPSIAKAGIANHYALKMETYPLIPNGIYQFSEKRIRDYMGRGFEVVKMFDYNRKKFDQYLNSGSIKKANLASRYFKMSPQELKKAHKLQDGGEDYFFFFEHKGQATCVHGRKFEGID